MCENDLVGFYTRGVAYVDLGVGGETERDWYNWTSSRKGE